MQSAQIPEIGLNGLGFPTISYFILWIASLSVGNIIGLNIKELFIMQEKQKSFAGIQVL